MRANAQVFGSNAQVFSQMRKILLTKKTPFWGILRVAPRANPCFWAVMRDFARANAQVLKWARQKCVKSGKKFAKVCAF